MTDPRNRVRTGYDEIAATYTAERSSSAEPFVDRVLRELPHDGRVLDAGCGAGSPILQRIPGDRRAIGLDIARGQLDLAAATFPAVPLVQGTLDALPLAGGVCDAIVCLHALIHVPRRWHDLVIAEFARVLRPDGRLLLTCGTEGWIGRNPDWLDTGVAMEWSFHGRERTEELLAEAGFTVRATDVADDGLGEGAWCYVLAER